MLARRRQKRRGKKNLAMRNEHQEEDDDRCNGKSTPSCFIPLHEAGRTVSAVAAEIKRFDICVLRTESAFPTAFGISSRAAQKKNNQHANLSNTAYSNVPCSADILVALKGYLLILKGIRGRPCNHPAQSSELHRQGVNPKSRRLGHPSPRITSSRLEKKKFDEGPE